MTGVQTCALPISTAEEIKNAADALNDAVSKLAYKDADYSKVDAAIKEANALNKADYKDFSKVDAAIEAVVRGKNIKEQEAVDRMAQAIIDAMNKLEKKPEEGNKPKPDEGNKPKPDEGNKPSQGNGNGTGTGVSTNAFVWPAVMSISAILGAVLLFVQKKIDVKF